MEIERKFLIKENSFDLSKYDFIEIQQAYICTAPVIRVRMKNNFSAGYDTPFLEEYILTVKSNGMLSREEFELKLDKADYLKLLDKAEGNIITKRRYIIPLEDKLTLELDFFRELFDGIVLGEIEFESEEAANKYNLPDFIIQEVTYDKRYHNSNMSQMSKEQILDLTSSVH